MVNTAVSSVVVDRACPCPGDLLIAPHEGRLGRYAVAQVPGAPQMSWASRAAAVEAARLFARRHAVDVWMCDGSVPVQIASHRPADKVSAAAATSAPLVE